VAAVQGYGATIVWAGADPLDRERRLEALLEETGAVFVHPSDTFHVIAGQGTAALELLEQVPELDLVLVPVGGGGLLTTGAETLADGLRTFLGQHNFPIIRQHVRDILTVSEGGIVDGMRLVWERMKLVIEPSSAVPVAALFEHPDTFRGRRVGIVISGGNADLARLPFDPRQDSSGRQP
jgi:threonine dehydratase